MYQATGRMSRELKSDPVMAADGHMRMSGRRSSAGSRRTKSTSPLTGGELEHSILVRDGEGGGAQGGNLARQRDHAFTSAFTCTSTTLEFHRVLVGVSLPPVICDL